MLPLTSEQFTDWQRRLERSRALRNIRMDSWKMAVQKYNGDPLSKESLSVDDLVVNKEFPFVEMKKSQLMFQVPEVHLEPKLPGLEGAAKTFQAVLNQELGPDGANLKATLNETLLDVLTMGIGPTKIGYTVSLGTRPVMEPQTDELGQPVLDESGQPAMVQTGTEPFVQKEDYFWERISPTRYLLPAEFWGADYDKAPWQAYEFDLDADQAQRRYQIPEDFDFIRPDDKEDDLTKEKADLYADTKSERRVRMTEIWYRASLFDEKVTHPDKMRILTLVEGHDEPVEHRDSPYQRETPTGTLLGMRGSPLHTLVFRAPAPNSAYPRSDIEISASITDELTLGRQQMIRQRETSIPLRFFDQTRVSQQTIDHILAGKWQQAIPAQGPIDETMFREVARATFPRENFMFQEVGERQFEEMWAIGKNQRGLTEDATRTATEIQTTQAAADTRLAAERTLGMEWLTRGARKFGSLVQLFKTDTSYVMILGQEGAQSLQPWDRDAIAGEFVYKIKPDSAVRMDVAVRRKQYLDLYNLTGKDPNVKRVELLKTLFRLYDMDPSLLVEEKLPEPGPEPPKLSLSFSGEDLLNPNVLALLKANGLKVPEEADQNAQLAEQVRGLAGTAPPPHGGATPRTEPISQHALRGDGSAPAGRAQRPQGPRTS